MPLHVVDCYGVTYGSCRPKAHSDPHFLSFLIRHVHFDAIKKLVFNVKFAFAKHLPAQVAEVVEQMVTERQVDAAADLAADMAQRELSLACNIFVHLLNQVAFLT